MSANAQYRLSTHFQAAFGGAFGVLNLIVGAVSTFRQLAKAFDIGLSPVLKSIFAGYTEIFHGLVDLLAKLLSWPTGFDLVPPPWAHDWIVLWLVLAGAAYRLAVATSRAEPYAGRDTVVSNYPPGIALNLMRELRWAVALLGAAIAILFRVPDRWVWTLTVPADAISAILTYILAVLLWPLALLEIWFVEPKLGKPYSAASWEPFDKGIEFPEEVRVSYLAVFWLQTLAIISAILGLSVLNAQTM